MIHGVADHTLGGSLAHHYVSRGLGQGYVESPNARNLQESRKWQSTSEDATKERLTAPSVPGVDGAAGGPVPEANRPGHHPPHEQDKPSGRDFVAKTHALAHEGLPG